MVLSYVLRAALPDLPFLNRMSLVFLLSLALAVVLSLLVKSRADANRVTVQGIDFRTTTGFNVASLGIVLILIALYATWW